MKTTLSQQRSKSLPTSWLDLERYTLMWVSQHFYPFISRKYTHAEVTGTLLWRSQIESALKGLASCFVSDRYSWPTSRHASSCTKAPLCAINHVKPARSHKSLLWGNSPFQIYKMVVVGKRDVLVEMSEEWWYWGMRPDVWGILIWFASSSWFRAM